ncbi:MAG TPA: T9SS type A sorting domain-containing protein [Rubricoccaceae bacterium]|jgi:hypothetical protein
MVRLPLSLGIAVSALLLAAAPSWAQTTDLVGLFNTDNSSSSPASGMALVRVTDNPAPSGDVLVVRGQFRGLPSAYVASRIRRANGGPVIQNLSAGLAEGGRAGGWGTVENTYGISDDVTAALLGGGAVVEITTEGAPGGDSRATLYALPVVVDGRLDEPTYQTVATKQNANAGFGPAIDVTSTRVALGTQVVVIGVTGRLNTASSDGIGLFLAPASGEAGVAAGTSLGGTPGAGHFLGAPDHPNFKADVRVNVALALNPGGGTESVFVDLVRYGEPSGARQADYLGAAAQDGGLAIGPPDQIASEGTSAAPVADVAFAFRNDGAAASGFEIVVPYSDLGFPVPVAERGGDRALLVSAFVVSATAFFSDVTVPGTVAAGNLGFDPDFRAVPGGPYFGTGGGFVALTPGPDGPAALRLVGPNPTAGRTRLALTLEAARAVRVDVLDALGRVVAVLHDGPAGAGDTEVVVDVSGLPAGVYAVRVAGPGLHDVQRLTVAR